MESAENEVVLEVSSSSGAGVAIVFDINPEFPEKDRLEKFFGEIDAEGMDVPPMSCKVKEEAVRRLCS